MSLRSGEIAPLIAELRPLAGSRVDAVRVHAERLVTLELRGPAGDATLLLSAEPDLTRIHAAARAAVVFASLVAVAGAAGTDARAQQPQTPQRARQPFLAAPLSVSSYIVEAMR